MILKDSVREKAAHLLISMCLTLLTQTTARSVTKRLSFIQSKRQDHIGISTLKHQGETFVDATDKANVFADHFSSVFTSEDITHIPTLSTKPLPSISSIQIHMDGVYQLLQNIHQHKASGPDNLPARFLKEVAYKISPILTMIFQASLDQVHCQIFGRLRRWFPFLRRVTNQTHVTVDLCLLNVFVAKFWNTIVYSSISSYEQHGFHYKRSCETQLINAVNDFAKCLNQNGQYDILLLILIKHLIRSHIIGCILSLHTTVLMEVSYCGSSPSYLVDPSMWY